MFEMAGGWQRLRCMVSVWMVWVGLTVWAGGQDVAVPVSQGAAPASSPAAPVANDPDATITNGKPLPPKTPAELRRDAWALLTNAAQAEHSVELRIQGLAALGTMGRDARTVKLIREGMQDKDVDVRTAAVLAAGQTRSPALVPELRRMLDDKEPQVVFTAASTLWKMHDHSGEDVLEAVLDGDRKANGGMVHGTLRSVDKDLHDPAGLAKLGAMEGASMLLGPFGFGITAYEYVKKNGGESARVVAIDELAEEHTTALRKELLDALTDKDQGVRVAAAKALRGYHDAEVAKALAGLFGDAKHPVQLSAAAAYLIATRDVAMPVVVAR